MVRDRDGRPQEDPWQCTASVYVVVIALWGDLLGVSRSMERDLLSILSICPRISCVYSVCIVS